MASCFFLLKQFEDVLVYLKSIKQYLSSDDDFNWNYGIACASTGDWGEAEEAFAAVQGQGYRQEGAFLNWSARVYIMQGGQLCIMHAGCLLNQQHECLYLAAAEACSQAGCAILTRQLLCDDMQASPLQHGSCICSRRQLSSP